MTKSFLWACVKFRFIDYMVTFILVKVVFMSSSSLLLYSLSFSMFFSILSWFTKMIERILSISSNFSVISVDRTLSSMIVNDSPLLFAWKPFLKFEPFLTSTSASTYFFYICIQILRSVGLPGGQNIKTFIKKNYSFNPRVRPV